MKITLRRARSIIAKVPLLVLIGMTAMYSSSALCQVVTHFSYDLGDNVSTETDPRGLVTTYAHDGLGQQWKQVSPDTGTTSFSYDGYGRLASMTRADGTQTSYGYDAISRRTSVSAGGLTHTFTYDTCTNGVGRLCAAGDATGTTSYTYTPEGWLAGRGFSVGGTSYALGYGYNALGQVTSVVYPDNNQALYTYSHGVVTLVQLNIGGTEPIMASGVTYQPNDLAMTQWTSGNGLTNTLSYDTDGRLTGISVPGVQSLGLSYDVANRVNGITNGIDSTMTQQFGYDAMSRLTSVYSGADNESLQYDANGNRTLQVLNGSSVNVAPSTSNNQITSLSGASNVTYGYDPRGNLTTVSGTPTFTYDVFNRMSGAAGATYYVNPEGQRLRKTVGTTATLFAPDSSGPLMAESQGSGWSDYVWLNGHLIGRINGGQVLAIHDDQVGRPEVMTGATKAIVWRARNFAFDRTVTVANAVPLNLGFPGQYYDAESGNWNNGFRDYSPSLGRYLESDPLGASAGVNTYAYVVNSPVRNVDGLGLETGVAFHAVFTGDGGVPNTEPVRTPDIVVIDVGYGPISASATYTKYGDTFVGYSLNPTAIAKGGRPQAGGVAYAIGYLLACDDNQDAINSAVGGASGGASFYYGLGGGFSNNSSGSFLFIGVGFGQFSYGSSYNEPQGNIFTGK